MKTKKYLCESLIADQYSVELTQDGETKEFTITYGKHVVVERDEEKAVDEYLSCLSHAMMCAGLFNERQALGRHEVPD